MCDTIKVLRFTQARQAIDGARSLLYYIPARISGLCEPEQPHSTDMRAFFVPASHKGTIMSRIKWVNLIPYPCRVDYAVGNHCVYLVYARLADLYKIGWTGDLTQRLPKLELDQHDIPGPFRLVHSIDTECGRYLERQLHLLFRHRHSIREWYRLTRMDVAWFIDLGTSLPDGISAQADIVPPLAEWTD